LHLPLAEISPWLDLKAVDASVTHAVYAGQDHRRIIKTHTPLDGLPWFPEATYICVQRDPRVIFVCLLNHMQNFNPDADAMFNLSDNADEREALPEDPNTFFQMWLTNG
ncbi:MAG TPA: hypothetical protein DIC52_09065, partial [Candidatus Latescibacteria bacterium]|nr:hypothetical protein [Candidatus Latescibacterota bacterium]